MSEDQDKLRPADRPNEMRLFNECKPAYQAGDTIELEVGQRLDRGYDTDDKQQLAIERLRTKGTVALKVEGPRFELQPTDVLGVYPADGSEDSPPRYLPHLTLARRTLPWERNGPSQGKPWLALLLIDEREVPSFEGVQELPIGEIQAIDEEAYTRILDADNPASDASDETVVSVVELPRALATRVLPKEEDIDKLIHVRRLISDTPLRQLDDDGDVVVIIGPRLPTHYGEDETPTVHHALLVSLENRDDLMTRGAVSVTSSTKPRLTAPTASKTRLRARSARTRRIRFRRARLAGRRVRAKRLQREAGRLARAKASRIEPETTRPGRLVAKDPTVIVALHHWSFTPATGSDDFESVIKAIRFLPNGGVLRFGTLPRAEARSEERQPLPTVLDDQGQLVEAMDYPQTPGGAAIYRGPLSPKTPAPRHDVFALRARPEELSGTDAPQKAVEQSDLAAFELGRLLALSDANVLSAMQWIMPRLRLPEIEDFYAVDPRPGALRFPDEVINPADAFINRWAGYEDVQGLTTRIETKAARQPELLTDYGGLGHAHEQILGEVLATLAPLEQLGELGELGQIDIDQLDVEQLEQHLSTLVKRAE